MLARNLLVATAFVISLAMAGCTDGGGTASAKSVSATDNQFTPNSLSIKENTKVTFTNDGERLHSVTVHKGGDAPGTTKKDTDIPKDASTEYTFSDAGTYHVYCKYHAPGAVTGSDYGTGMVMTVTVSEN